MTDTIFCAINDALVLKGVVSCPDLKNLPIACFTMVECFIIMAEQHISETHYLFLKENDKMSCVSNTVLL